MEAKQAAQHVNGSSMQMVHLSREKLIVVVDDVGRYVEQTVNDSLEYNEQLRTGSQ